MNDCYVFVGPSVSAQDAATHLQAVYLPPVSQGEVYRVSLKRPRAIGIIDGYFERMPSVWHKEILWALSRGIHVYGSASMGALRAAELSQFGMKGIGLIYEAFREGRLLDDDEVAVVHGSSDMNYRPLSEAMVNIRVTFGTAEMSGIISPQTGVRLVQIAKKLFYPERSYPSVLAIAEKDGVPLDELEALRDWLPQGRVDQKREDAIGMLQAMRDNLETDREPMTTKFVFEHTSYWDQLIREAGQIHDRPGGYSGAVLADRLLDELRLSPDASHIKDILVARALALYWADCEGVIVSDDTLQATCDSFRRKQMLFEVYKLDTWLRDHALDFDGFSSLMKTEAKIQAGLAAGIRGMHEYVLNYLKIKGDYRRVIDRALDKQKALELFGQDNPSLIETGLNEEGLMRWFFEDHLRKPLPDDFGEYAISVGFEDEDSFRRAVLREYLYSSYSNQSNDPESGGAQRED